MFQDITVPELLELHRKGELALIDCRSPAEYAESTIPGSVNVPLFDNGERAEIGTIYKQVSVEAAQQRGLEIVSAKLPALIREVQQLEPRRKAVFCWRGGMRSKTTATLADLMGLRMYRLTGGFRAYRRWVVETLEQYDRKERTLPPIYVINGFTGTGKTKLLRELARRGYPVIDLEAMAGHRGSIFGHIGQQPVNQKTFDSLLVQELDRLSAAPYLLLEAESKRIGKIMLPAFLTEAKEVGTTLFIDLPMKQRVNNIIEDYNPAEHKQASLESFARIEKRLHTPIAAEIRQLLQDEYFEKAVELLLDHYYDPRYDYAAAQYAAEREIVRAATPAGVLKALLQRLPAPVNEMQA